MEVRLDVYRADEFLALGEFFGKLGAIAKARELAEPKDGPCFPSEEVIAPAPVDPAQTTLPLAVEPETKKERKPRAKKEPAPAPAPSEPGVLDVEPVAQDAPKQAEVVVEAEPAPAPAPAPAAPAVDTKKLAEELAAATRDLAKRNFEAAKKLLEQFGVKRFTELAETQPQRLPEYQKAIAAL